MASLHIENAPAIQFNLVSCATTFSISLSESVKGKLKEGEVLTNATALRIFKEIELESSVLSFLTNPFFAIPLSAVVLIASFAIPAAGTALLAAKFFMSFVGGSMLGYSVTATFRGLLPLLSNSYAEQSKLASSHIKTLEDSKEEMKFTFDPPPVYRFSPLNA